MTRQASRFVRSLWLRSRHSLVGQTFVTELLTKTILNPKSTESERCKQLTIPLTKKQGMDVNGGARQKTFIDGVLFKNFYLAYNLLICFGR